MNFLKLKMFGSILTGREYGKDSMKKINVEYPVTLDFSGVNSLGSSFADEVLIPIAAKQNNRIDICNANSSVINCIRDTADDGGFEFNIV